ncbi:MAG: hypothetical protein HY825_08185 [Acidobacteria bacterium]|nr:hypothetical protein [Acidobacteriota bacterium]
MGNPSVGRRASGWLATILVTGALVGCMGSEPSKPLVVAFGENPVALDPQFQDRNTAWSVLSSFYDPLVSFTPELKLEPALARSWEQVDATHWRFELRTGVTFAGGGTLTADDVVASFERARNHPRSAVRHYVTGIREVRAVTEQTVEVETSGPAPDLLERLTFLLVIPRRAAGHDEIEQPDGTGPYRFLGRLGDGTVVARARAGWRPRPEIAEVRFVFCGTDAEAARRLVAGEVDVSHLLPDDLVGEIAGVPNLRVVEQPRLAVQLLSIHPEAAEGSTRRALADPRVRRALLLALDRQRWVDRLFRGRGVVASQYVHPAVLGFDPGLVPEPTDRAEARRLIAEAGFSEGFDVDLRYSPTHSEVVAAIVGDLAHVNVRVTAYPSGTSPAAGISGKDRLGLVYFAWACSTGDGSDFLNSLVRSRNETLGVGEDSDSYFVDRELDTLLSAADTEVDRDARLRLLQAAQRRVLRSLPLLPLTIRGGSKGVSSRVEVVTRYDERECVAAFRWRRD